jgi:hypothetical protein
MIMMKSHMLYYSWFALSSVLAAAVMGSIVKQRSVHT